MIAAQARPAAEVDVTLLVLIAALVVLGAVALVVAVLTDPGPEMDEFEDDLDADDSHGPRSLRSPNPTRRNTP